MKRIKTLIGITCLAAMMGTSCVDEIKFGDSFLEKAPGVAITQDSIFGKAEYARRFLWSTYRQMYYGIPFDWSSIGDKMNTSMFECLSDCYQSHNSWAGPNRYYYSGTYTASTEDDENSQFETRFSFINEGVWEAVRAAWLFIENVDRVPDMEEAERERLKAEAKLIIATRYFDVFRHFGGVPIVKQSFEVDTDFQVPRGTVEETVNFMLELCDEAASVLPWDVVADGESNWQGRMTRAAALGLKCKILLFAASPLFNDNVPYCTSSPQEAVEQHLVWYGGYKPELWTQCLEACETFFEELQSKGHYELVQADGTDCDDYRDAFNTAYFTRESTELLISTRVIGQYTGDWWYYWDQWVPYGNFTPTLEYMEMFPMSDGRPFDLDKAIEEKNMFFEGNDYRNAPSRDPRLYETILVNGADLEGRPIELWHGGRDNASSTINEIDEYATGFGLYKFYKGGYYGLYGSYLEWPYLRLAEVYLIYAEALLKNNRIQEAIAQVDIIRNRVGLNGLVESNPDKNMMDPDVLMEAILNERACELGLEDVRFFDMIRNKRADLFERPLHGLLIERADGGTGSWSDKSEAERGPYPTEYTYTKFQLQKPGRTWWNGFDPKWYLAAFPVREVNKGYGLVQNPGW